MHNTGFIKADEDLKTHSVNVEYCFYHHNHSIEIAHLTMDEQLYAHRLLLSFLKE